MLIQPVQPVYILIKIGEAEYSGQLLSLSEENLEFKCDAYIEKISRFPFSRNIFVAKQPFRKLNLIIRSLPTN